jgi:maleate isomerase
LRASQDRFDRPSSNTTIKTELPRLFGAVPDLDVTFHSARVRMKHVIPEELKGND